MHSAPQCRLDMCRKATFVKEGVGWGKKDEKMVANSHGDEQLWRRAVFIKNRVEKRRKAWLILSGGENFLFVQNMSQFLFEN